jgi:GNAT superfamily N-acetyltransferase
MELACAASSAAGLPGEFRVWEQSGVLAVLAAGSGLGFLSTVSGVTRETVGTAVEVVNASVWNGVRPAVLVSTGLGAAGEALLLAAGLVRTEDRVLAVRGLDASVPEVQPDVVAAAAVGAFLDVLVAGYGVAGMVAAFIRAEHELPVMRRFLVLAGGVPVAAAGMTIHQDVAVLGGASTLPAFRGRGAQSRLLRHRLRLAADAGCALAVATARPDSVSAANLGRAGFRVLRRSVWLTPAR